MNHFDLLHAARTQLRQSPATWRFEHVKGHQDASSRDHAGDLNDKMDALAKKYWAEKFGEPFQGPSACQQEVEGEPISVYIDGEKVATKFREKIYDLVHGPKVIQHWVEIGRFPERASALIDWSASGRAMQDSTLEKRTWVMKQAAGLMGVNKWMHRWGCLLYTSPSPRDLSTSRMPSSA